MKDKITMGALSPQLHKQLDVPPSLLELEQRLADAITLCNIHSVLTDTETHKARKRLMKQVATKLKGGK